jgi:metallo-beta-lactamase family protein
MNHFRCSVYGKEKKINDNFKFTFYDAGHILGSSMVDVSIPKYTTFFEKLFHKKSKNRMHVLFTGDLGRKNNPICNPPETNMPAPEYIIMESTYGNKTHETIDTVYQELAYLINRTIERKGKIIIPSFAIERAQELIYFIKVLTRENKIPRIPIWIDSPMAANATGVFNIHPECFNEKIKNEFIAKGKNPFSVRNLKFVNNYKESLRIAKSDKPAIIISCNGMCEAGRILNHLKYGISNPNNTILFVGYQVEGTLGRKILEKVSKINIDKNSYEVKAEIHKINSFSAHADYKEMLEWLNKIDTSKLRKIFLVHGEKEAQKHLSDYLKSNGFKNIQIVKEGEVYKL